MKLITTKEIRNVPSLRLKDDGESTIENAKHADHIHKGAIFSIGDDKYKLSGVDQKGVSDLTRLAKTDAQSAYNISLLVHADCVADATDDKAVAAVKLSIKEDEAREANAKKLDQSANSQNVVSALLQAVRGMKPV